MDQFSPALEAAMRDTWNLIFEGKTSLEAVTQVAKKSGFMWHEIAKGMPLRYKLVPIEELSNIKMASGNEKKVKTIVHNRFLKTWVGVGWVTERPATRSDKAFWLAYE